MNLETLKKLCLSLPDAKENFPWTEPQYQNLSTFTVEDKWFCLLNNTNEFIDIKCAPTDIPKLQEKFSGVFPAWHMDKKHWIGVRLHSDLTDAEIEQLIKNSFDLVVQGLPKKERGLVTQE